MLYQRERQLMVAQQLQRRGISDARVLTAMTAVPREMFVPDPLRGNAYADRALPLEHEQTISQPYTVAFMCEALQLEPDEVVLEVGTGSGYGAAVLSKMARHVHTIERIPELAEQAQQRLAKLGYRNITVHQGDGSLGLPSEAPFDASCVTAAGGDLPQAYVEQLSDGGRIVIPLEDGHGQQTMQRITRDGAEFRRESLGTFTFVPLIRAQGKQR